MALFSMSGPGGGKRAGDLVSWKRYISLALWTLCSFKPAGHRPQPPASGVGCHSPTLQAKWLFHRSFPTPLCPLVILWLRACGEQMRLEERARGNHFEKTWRSAEQTVLKTQASPGREMGDCSVTLLATLLSPPAWPS